MSSVIKINAITVPEDSGTELGERFAARHGSMDGTPGFQGYELLQPSDGRNVWLVVTRWDSEEDFENWRNSQHFAKSHGEGQEGAKKKPVGMSSELWSYTVSTTG
ncbi:antibiotic biosynthesis monooxygenase family protein [Nesterenkonia alkaliphila]|uniref:Antibiotic biosynthesis monooxygenase n=1 Tax=Nesterenkonia alkaliphila TaxID=1463631 RepID=A0A7K1UGJ3_9MICC|nr:antibiotic biosynthesis monooxygenase family protein [Nesterenkonia alkaliphila]MVT25211.1 antibiotic biosynthesis monooxygenase [Nesterenkonia alkaliphila]GFZ97563.1 monooxygenase [Nesterenkonia alkaliphila]